MSLGALTDRWGHPYNSAGERTHKRRTSLETVYVNPYYVIRNLLFQTKHIYAGPTRIVSAVVTLNDRLQDFDRMHLDGIER